MRLAYPQLAPAFQRAIGGWFRLWLSGTAITALLVTGLLAAFGRQTDDAYEFIAGASGLTATLGVASYMLLLFLRLGIFLPQWIDAGFSTIERETVARYGKPLLRFCAFVAALFFIAVLFRYDVIATRPAGDGIVAYIRWDRWTAEAKVEYRDVTRLPTQWRAAQEQGDSALFSAAHAGESPR